MRRVGPFARDAMRPGQAVTGRWFLGQMALSRRRLSDRFSFVRAGVPAAALKFGFLPGAPEAQIEHDWRAVRYHSAEDNLGQPVDLEAACRFGAFLTAYVLAVADAAERPRWLPTNAFAP